MKKYAPATLRNRDAIAAVLAKELPASGTVLEVASGTGEHAVYFASRFPDLIWQPSDPSEEALASIEAWRDVEGSANLLPPLQLDASSDQWPIDQADVIVCINMVHISPWEASEGLFAGAARLLNGAAPLILYGPYIEPDVETAQSNLEFDASLKSRNPRWGLRSTMDVDRLAAQTGFKRANRYQMPANNLILVYRRMAEA
uniref:DUF938 domain-containing protein n=1 Tax=uncultured Altererythrobacter sp. TaxID=500840 RepID=UPI002611E477|nr:DUF938 domain-containing protein [uncultured Altererythrobacter sp.]